MKVLFYSHTGKVSGAERIMLMILERLNRSRFTASVVCPAEDDLAQTVKKMGVECATVEQLQARFTWRVDLLARYLFSFFRTMKQLRREISEKQPDLIHANSIRAGLVATAASVGKRTPVIWILQDALPRHPISTLIRLFVLFSSRTRLMPASQATLDRFRGKILRRFGKNIKAKVVHNAIEPEKFRFEAKNRRLIRNELNLPDEEFVMAIVGQITTRKGQLELIETFARARKRMPSATLLIVGAPMFNQDDIYLETLKETVKNLDIAGRVKFLGSRDDVAEIMQASDLLVINSKSEALVIVAIEAMACRTAIVATDVGGTSEIIRHKSNGWLVPFGDEKALREAIVTLAEKPEMRRKFAAESEKSVFKNLTAKRLIGEVEDFYERCALPERAELSGNLAIEN